MTEIADVSWPKRTERGLSIRPAVPADLEAYWRFRGQPGVTEWTTRAHQEWDEFYESASQPDWLGVAFTLEFEGVVIGDLMLRVEDLWSQTEVKEQAARMQAELGWTLDPAYQGKGYATEAVLELMRICFEDLGLHRVTALCFAANDASWKVMERVGMRREAHNVKDSLHRNGQWMDGFLYALLDEEWADRRAGAAR